MTTSRQPQGTPIGGQFAATSHSEASVSLGDDSDQTQQLAERDAVRDRREWLEAQLRRMDRLAAAYSVRGLSSALLAKYSEAATLTIRQNDNGENQYDLLYLKDSSGEIIENAYDDDEWTRDEAENGTNMREFAYDFDLQSDAWADGVATVTRDRADGKTAVIDLKAGLNAPLPRFKEEADPSTRTLTEDEQRILVDAAYEGLDELNDKLSKDRSMDYDEADLEEIREPVAATRKVLNPTAES